VNCFIPSCQETGKKQGLGAWDPAAKACPIPLHASITRSICPAAQESPTNLEKNSFFSRSDAGISMKKKDGRGKLWGEAGMLLKKKEIRAEKRECW
jgi:hypothetical protein